MPLGNNLPASMKLMKLLLLANERVGKSDYALRAAESGFNVLYVDGDGAQRTLEQINDFGKARIAYFNVMDRIVDGHYEHRMIDFAADLFGSTKVIWNDTLQEPWNRATQKAEESEIWEIYPSKLDHTWVCVMDSWTALSMSALAHKAEDLSIDLADVEKVDRKIYSGVGNRLTQLALIMKGAPCHIIVCGHPAEYAKKRAPEGKVVRNIKEEDMITEWTRMIPKSSSNPHGLTVGKNFTDIAWIDIDLAGRRKIDFDISQSRTSGGSITGKGDPRGDYSFANLIRQSGGFVPGDAGAPMTPALVMYKKGEWQPAAIAQPKPLVLGAKPAASPTIQIPAPNKGLAGLLNKATTGETSAAK